MGQFRNFLLLLVQGWCFVSRCKFKILIRHERDTWCCWVPW